MDKNKALKLALEFVENVHLGEWQGSTERQEEIVTAINKALAQPAQEPTKYSFRAHWEADGCIGVVAAIERLDGGVHLLKDIIDAPQRPWVGLTLDEIALIHANYPNPQGFGLALQAKLKERNT